MEIPREIVDKFKRQEKIEKQREDKKKASMHYKRRKLDKDVRQYIKGTRGPLRLTDIERIGRRHGFYVS